MENRQSIHSISTSTPENKKNVLYPWTMVSQISFLMTFLAGGTLVLVVYPVLMLSHDHPAWLPWVVSLVLGFVSGTVINRWFASSRHHQS